MALGGGIFTTQNKILSGSYINFVSANKTNLSLTNRGVAILGVEHDWGVDDDVITITNDDFQRNSLKLLGYEYTDDKLKGFRDMFLNLNTLRFCRLNKGTKAENTFAIAKYSGERGNALKVVIKVNVDEQSKKDVLLYLDTKLVDSQTVTQASELVDNDFVSWKKGAELTPTAGVNLSSGTNGNVSASNHQEFLNKAESYNFNILACLSNDTAIKKLYIAFTKRMRNDVGLKFQTVVFNEKADFEGVINVKNSLELVYWVTGAEASCEVNKSLTNKKYDGEYKINTNYTQNELIQSIKDGEFVFHKDGNEIKVLSDINSLTTVSDEKGDIFNDNQTIRVIDQIAMDIALIFNKKYSGQVPNDENGRISLWNDIVKHHEHLQKIRAIENFNEDDIVVTQGESKKGVLVQNKITVVNAMTQLYMIVKVA